MARAYREALRVGDLGGASGRADTGGGCGFWSSLQFGLERIPEIAEAASIQLDLPPKALERYLTENIHFGLEPDFLAGLELYYQKCAAVGAIPHAKPLRFAAAQVLPGAGARAGR